MNRALSCLNHTKDFLSQSHGIFCIQNNSAFFQAGLRFLYNNFSLAVKQPLKILQKTVFENNLAKY